MWLPHTLQRSEREERRREVWELWGELAMQLDPEYRREVVEWRRKEQRRLDEEAEYYAEYGQQD